MMPCYVWSQIHCKSTLITPCHLCPLYPCTLGQMNKGENASRFNSIRSPQVGQEDLLTNLNVNHPPQSLFIQCRVKGCFSLAHNFPHGALESLGFVMPHMTGKPRLQLFHARLTFLKGNVCSRRRNSILTPGPLHLLFPTSDPSGHLSTLIFRYSLKCHFPDSPFSISSCSFFPK